MRGAPNLFVATTITVSEVEVSLSTVTLLKVSSAIFDTSDWRVCCSTDASVNINASIVAISGAIIPEPFANPAMLIVDPPISTEVPAPFEKVSVVMIARAAPSIPSDRKPSRKDSTTAAIRSLGSGTPITPVEAVNTCRSDIPRVLETKPASFSTALTPTAPVNAFEFPEFTRIANPSSTGSFECSSAILLSQSSTGAERVAERVKTPATVLSGAILASMTSSRPL